MFRAGGGRVMRHARIVAIASLALLAGCGAAAGSGAASGPSPATTTVVESPAVRSFPAEPTATQSASPTVFGPGHVLTTADSGAVVALRPGDNLTVELLPGPGVYAWDRPRRQARPKCRRAATCRACIRGRGACRLSVNGQSG